MANEFGGPSAQGSFLTGLAGSIATSIKEDYDQRHKEDEDKKAFDYQLLVKAMNDPDITPSQARELLTRAVDIYKPKGHGGIKENLKEVFGRDAPYEMQAGKIVNEVTGKPRMNVQAPTQTATPGGTGPDQIRSRTVTLPAPPQSRPELTYRELDREDATLKQQDTLDRQIVMENLHDEHIRERQKVQNQASLEKFIKENNFKDASKAEAELNKRAAMYGDYTDPTVRERARIELQAEKHQTDELVKAKLANIQDEIKDRAARRQIAEKRIEQAERRIGSMQTKDNLKNDVNVQQADGKIKTYTALGEAARKKSMDAYAQVSMTTGDTAKEWLAEAKKYEELAQQDEKVVDETLQAKSDYLGKRAGLVVLPNAPGKAHPGEDPKVRAYADKYFKGDYATADAYRKAHP